MFGLSFSFEGFRILYASIAALMWLMTGLFSIEYFKGHKKPGRYFFFYGITFLSVLGVFFAGDLLTLFLFFEIMSFTSYTWVAQEETKEALAASKTYLAVAVFGGLAMLMGLFMLNHAGFGNIAVSEIFDLKEIFLWHGREGALSAEFGNGVTYLVVAAALLIVGFAAKAGVFPLHIWLPKAHPVAPAPASALLSGMLTKCGVFGMLLVAMLLIGGQETFGQVIFWLGVVTMVLGALLGVFSIDLKKILACSSVSQIGFITVGIGVLILSNGMNESAFYGVITHMINHSVLKLALFMAAGAVYMKAHTLNLNELRGYGRKYPFLGGVFLFGGCGLAGIPMFNGFISKTLLHEGIVEYMEELSAEGVNVSAYKVAEGAFLFAGGLTLAYMLKIFIALFVEKGEGEKIGRKEPSMSPVSAFAIGFSALLIVVLGMTPNLIFAKFGKLAKDFFFGFRLQTMVGKEIGSGILTDTGRFGLGSQWLNAENLKGTVISVTIGVLVYLVVVRLFLMSTNRKKTVYVDRMKSWMDLETSFYRPVFFGFLAFICALFCRICDSLVDGLVALLRNTVFAPRKHRMTIWVGTRLTHMLGSFMDGVVKLLNRSIFRNHPIRKSFVSVFAVTEMEVKQTFGLVTGSVSFGLLLAAAGLVITLLCLLI